jgi:hypothetical protein
MGYSLTVNGPDRFKGLFCMMLTETRTWPCTLLDYRCLDVVLIDYLVQLASTMLELQLSSHV